MLPKKSKPLFTQQQVISVQDIHFFFLTAHTHGSYIILSTHQFSKQKNRFCFYFLYYVMEDWYQLFIVSGSCPFIFDVK